MNTEQQIKLMIAMQALFAEFYKTEMSARIKQGLTKRKKIYRAN
jgi:DNA invertase Pin-like site-specific DNA recombinase